jgi:hypothetical protein
MIGFFALTSPLMINAYLLIAGMAVLGSAIYAMLTLIDKVADS